MKNKSCCAVWVISRMLMLAAVAACARGGDIMNANMGPVETPTVDYVEALDVYSAPHQDSFLNQLAMNYRSYAIYNARTSGYADMGELFANKAVAAFSGEIPFPESLENWPVENEQEAFDLHTAYNDLMDQLMNDASYVNPELAAEAQAKFDCWLSASASGQMATAEQCRDRFEKTLTALRDCKNGKIVKRATSEKTVVDAGDTVVETEIQNSVGEFYPETRTMSAMNGTGNAREGVIIVNNVNVPEHLINPVPVQPMVFNQNIYGGSKTITKSKDDHSVSNSGNRLTAVESKCTDNSVHNSGNSLTAVEGAHDNLLTGCQKQESVPSDCVEQECEPCPEVEVVEQEPVEIPMVSEELVTREEFINMMMAMREELAAINARLDTIQAAAGEKTMIKVQQIPLEPKQHVMEEVFEIRFDFNKATIKPEYQELIEHLATATQENKNIKVSVVGHTDTSGSVNYNYALGGRRADAVQKMLIKYGIPASQIVAVSAGEQDLAVPTPDNTPNAENRRVRVVKEIHYTEPAAPVPMAIAVEEVAMEECSEYGCEQ